MREKNEEKKVKWRLMFSLPLQENYEIQHISDGRIEEYFKREVCFEIFQLLYYTLQICNVVFSKSYPGVL